MADFGHFSDTDDSAVEELLSEAQDLCVLDQVSKINCSGFTDSLLPSDLETRFRKLKSFPLSKSNVTSSESGNSQNVVSIPKSDDSLYAKSERLPHSKIESLKSDIFRDVKKNPDGKFSFHKGTEKGSPFSTFSSSNFPSDDDDCVETDRGKDLKNESEKGSASPLPDSSTSWIEALSISPSKQKGQKKGVWNSNSGSFSSASGSDLPSPPQKTGCFWCSPKKVLKKQTKVNWNLDWGIKDEDEFLSDHNIYSTKEQQKILKKVMKEEAKVSREAEKIVKWAKQVSGRMSSQNVEDYLSDDDDLTK